MKNRALVGIKGDAVEAPTSGLDDSYDFGADLTNGEEFMCLPNNMYDASGNWRVGGASSSASSTSAHDPVVTPPIINTHPTLPNPPLSATILSPDEDDIRKFDEDVEVDVVYDEDVVEGAQLWHQVYGQYPSREDYDSIEHLCAVIGGVPTEDQLRLYNSPLYSSSKPINVHGMKARVVRTADNPSLATVLASPVVQWSGSLLTRVSNQSNINSSQGSK